MIRVGRNMVRWLCNVRPKNRISDVNLRNKLIEYYEHGNKNEGIIPIKSMLDRTSWNYYHNSCCVLYLKWYHQLYIVKIILWLFSQLIMSHS